MAEEYENQEKTEEPSTHRIEEFRKKGEVASSRELTGVLVLSACTLVLTISLSFIYEELMFFVEWLYSLDFSTAYTKKSQSTIIYRITSTILTCVAPIFITVVCVAIISNVIQVGFLFAPDVLKWNIARIDPVKGFKKLFSTRALVEALKGILKFSIILFIVFLFMKEELFTFHGFLNLDLLQSALYGKTLLLKLAFFILLGLFLVALGDFAYQKFTYRKKLMQTKEQAKRETKEQEGNPEIKQRIKNLQREMAQKRMISNIPKADVIITNPTHISVALRYRDKDMVSPRVVAKGADFLALQIRKIAQKHQIPMVENIKLARILYKTVKTGEFIPRSLYKAVAEVLAFVYKLNRRKKALAVRS